MKFNLRVLSVAIVAMLCFGILAACGGQPVETTQPTTEAVTTAATAESEAFVIPADQMGLIVAADSTLITWNEYAVEDNTIDFMGVDTKELKDPAKDISLFYLEEDVTYYLIKDGKLAEATVEDLVSGAIVGITTLEEGVQEVYVLFVPAEDNGDNEVVDHVEEIVDVPTATTAAAVDEPASEEGTGDVVATEGAN